MLNELFTKRSANLDEILDGDNNPSLDEILNSREFQTNLINDLITGMKNIVSWKVVDHTGSIDDIERDENTFNIDYSFDFVYKFKDSDIRLTLYIIGTVDVDWIGSYRSATHYNPEEAPQAKIDYRELGRMLDLSLFDDGGNEISLKWLTPELELKVVKSIINPYL
jgi:hypothetical protein